MEGNWIELLIGGNGHVGWMLPVNSVIDDIERKTFCKVVKPSMI